MVKKLPSTGDMPRSTGVPASLVPGGKADSAGFPWDGRTFDHHGTAFADDTGHTPEAYAAAVAAVRRAVRGLTQAEDAADQRAALVALAEAHTALIPACTTARFLVPLIAEAGDFGITPEGKTVEKSQELSIVTVQSPDGRAALPVFSSVAAMQAWNPNARPIPVPGAQVALAAGQEDTDLVIIDAGNPDTEYVIRRPWLEAFALAKQQAPPWADEELQQAFDASIIAEASVDRVLLAPGDPASTLAGPELVVGLMVRSGLSPEEVRALTTRLSESWAGDELIARRVDSMRVQLRRSAR